MVAVSFSFLKQYLEDDGKDRSSELWVLSPRVGVGATKRFSLQRMLDARIAHVTSRVLCARIELLLFALQSDANAFSDFALADSIAWAARGWEDSAFGGIYH
jgi:hypothetical protein